MTFLPTVIFLRQIRLDLSVVVALKGLEDPDFPLETLGIRLWHQVCKTKKRTS